MFMKFSLTLTILTLALNLLSASSAAVPVPLRNSGPAIEGPDNLKDHFPETRVSPGEPKSPLKAQPQRECLNLQMV